MALARLRVFSSLARALGCREIGGIDAARSALWLRPLSSKAEAEGQAQAEDAADEGLEEEVPEGEPEPEPSSRSHRMVRGILKVTLGVPLLYGTMNVMTSMGDSWVRPAIGQVRCKDPFLQRSGASRLNLMAYKDERRKFVVEAGAVPPLMHMLHTAPDDKTRRAALEVLANLVQCEAGLEAVRGVPGGEAVVQAAAAAAEEDSEVQRHARALLESLAASQQSTDHIGLA